MEASFPEILITKNYNGKLDCPFFTIIRPDIPKYDKKKKFLIRLVKVDDNNIIKDIARPFQAELFDRAEFRLKDLPTINAYLDMGMGSTQAINYFKTIFPKIKDDDIVIMGLFKRL